MKRCSGARSALCKAVLHEPAEPDSELLVRAADGTLAPARAAGAGAAAKRARRSARSRLFISGAAARARESAPLARGIVVNGAVPLFARRVHTRARPAAAEQRHVAGRGERH